MKSAYLWPAAVLACSLSGSVVNGGESSENAPPSIIDFLKVKGCVFVTPSEYLENHP